MGERLEDKKRGEKMTCFTCKGNIEDKLTAFTMDIDGRVFIIKGVPSHVCTQCGAVSYSDEVMGQIEKMIVGMKNSVTEVSIATFAA